MSMENRLEGFTIIAGSDGIKINFETVYGFPDQTSYNGGFDVECAIKIWCGPFRVESKVFLSTGELYKFYQQLLNICLHSSGTAILTNHEDDFELSVTFSSHGVCRVLGRYRQSYSTETEMKFDMNSDLINMESALNDLRCIVERYGNDKGEPIHLPQGA
jgi:hypothetical protein